MVDTSSSLKLVIYSEENLWTCICSHSEKCFEISGYEVLETCSIDVFQISRTFFWAGDNIFNLLPKSWNDVCSTASMIVVKDTNNIKRKSKCLDELGSKCIQQCYYYEETSFFGKKKFCLAEHQQKFLSFPIPCKKKLHRLQGCDLLSKLIQAMLITCLAQQYAVKCILIKKKTLSGLAQILLAL